LNIYRYLIFVLIKFSNLKRYTQADEIWISTKKIFYDSMPPNPPKDETSLLKRIAQQDREALSQLYDRYARVMYSLAFKILNSVEEAEEVVLDVFSQVWRTAQNYDDKKGRVDNWLFLMTRSRSLDRLRKSLRQSKIIDASTKVVQEKSFGFKNIPEEKLLIRECREQVFTALAQLPEPQRQVIELAYYQGLTQSEIAKQMQISLGTVKTRVRLALKKLRSLLNAA